jgi:methionyl-tRNA formyltransferase
MLYTKNAMKVVFFGSSRYVAPVIETIHDNFDLPLVVTTEQNRMDAVPFYCAAKKIEYLPVRKSSDLISNYQIEGSLASIGVVADFGLLIPEQTMNVFEHGIINIHPSLLPKYRGPTPVQSAILNGDQTTGVTIIKLDKYLDHGPVIAQVEEAIKPSDTAKTLYERLFEIGAQLLVKMLNSYETSRVLFVQQNHDHATFTKALTKDDGYCDLESIFSGRDFFERMVRAYYPWPGVWSRLRLSSDGQAKVVKFLPNKMIQAESGNEMAYRDFLNGYPKADPTLINFLKKEI